MKQGTPTHEMKRAANLQLCRFLRSIDKHVSSGNDVMNARIKNLIQDIETFQKQVENLPAYDAWPEMYTHEFREIYRTTRRLGIKLD